jgi:hypothetical protein
MDMINDSAPLDQLTVCYRETMAGLRRVLDALEPDG